jgi:2-polyprenyl-6-methoxyphenol hydroxylase-like FAD-dependent oxidoreductase
VSETEQLQTDCAIVGGGPAGLMLGLLLARRGVRAVVLEQHGDFLRDFRGDTIHPSTQEVLLEIGLLERFLALPHADMPQVAVRFSGHRLVLADFRRLPTARRCITFMPQWDFLDLLADAGRELPGFAVRMHHTGTALLRDGDRVTGVRADGPDGPVEVRARLTVLADGRDSRLRAAAGLAPVGGASAIDVLWFRLPREPGEELPLMQIGDGALLAIDRGEFFQAAHIVRRGVWQGDEASMDAVRRRVAGLEPRFAERVAALEPSAVQVLRVRIDRLERWHRDGLLAIGDAAHAMSPAGGVGINLAIQDAVATANALAPRLAASRPTEAVLERIQRRREPPARATQAFQRRLERVLVRVAEPGSDVPVPLPLRVVQRLPALRHVAGRFLGIGLRPEHVAAPSTSARHAERR